MQDNLEDEYRKFQELYNLVPPISPRIGLNVAVIGKGTASLLLIPSLKKNGYNITVFFDSNKPELGVGESTVPTVQRQLASEEIYIESLVRKNIASYKTGVRFFDWGKSDTFDHPFHTNDLAFHFYTTDFNKHVSDVYEKTGVCNFIDEKVDKVIEDEDGVTVNGKKFDFVVNASGWSEDLTTYISSPFETVNAGITFTKNPHTAFTTTVHRATEHGWQFELPYPENNKSRCGYLFNRNISNTEEILNNFGYEIESYLKWNPRYSENIIVSNRQALIGNALFFFEPLQAFSTHYYCVFSDIISDYIGYVGNENKRSEINKRYRYYIDDYLNVIAFHYKYGSKHKTPFWTDIQKRAKEFLPDSVKSFKFFAQYDYDVISNGMSGHDFN